MRIIASITAAAAFVLCSTASAATVLQGAVTQLDAAIDARVAAIGTPPTRESKNLAKARATLGKYSGGTTATDIALIFLAAKQLVASRTQDPDIRAAGLTVIDAECDVAKDVRTAIVDAVDSLLDPADAAKANALLTGPDGVLAAAKSHLPDDPAIAELLVFKAYGKFVAAKTKADKIVAAENGASAPQGVAIYSTSAGLYLANTGTKSYRLQKVRVFATLTRDGAAPTVFTGQDGKTLVPGLFSGLHEGILDPVYVDSMGGHHAAVLDFTGPLLVELYPAGSTNVELKGRLWITFKGRPFFSVAIDLKRP